MEFQVSQGYLVKTCLREEQPGVVEHTSLTPALMRKGQAELCEEKTW